MCNLYSMTKNVDAIRRLFKVDPANDRTGNMPPLPGIYPDYPAPIVRNGSGGRELAMARWGMPPSRMYSSSSSGKTRLLPRRTRCC
jgi:putative SOS response-associated peptidase YedK